MTPGNSNTVHRDHIGMSRRNFSRAAIAGISSAAIAQADAADVPGEVMRQGSDLPHAERFQTHFTPRARRVIMLFMLGV